MTAAVAAAHVHKSFGTVDAVVDASFDIDPGEFVAIEGPSGSGKTTLLNLIGGIETPTSGIITIAGQELTALDQRARTILRRQQIGMIFQLYDLLPTLNAWQNVAVPALLDGQRLGQLKNHAVELLERVGLADRADHTPSELSGGEQQRVAVARSLVNSPSLILADEPTGALDSVAGDDVLQLLRSLCAEGQTVAMVTHSPRAAAYANRSIRMLDGRAFSIEDVHQGV